MYTNLKQYRCGGCGNEEYKVYAAFALPKGHGGKIITECTQCNSQTEIVIQPAELQLQWGENGDGIMCLKNNFNEEED